MSNVAITYLVAACAGVFSLAAYAAWILVPAWTAYSRTWQRLAAVFLSLYVLITFLGLGALAGFGVIYFWDNFT